MRSRRRLLRRPRFRVASHSGAEVVSLRQLSPKERLRVTSPSMFTTANLAAGFSAILLAFNHHFTAAAILMTVSILMDISDGAVARAVGATSPFGVQLDSMADLISFGLAPSVLVYTWALPERPVLAWFGAFFWLACAAFRLARFNFTIDPLADKRYFIGLPSPGAAAVVIATVFALDTPQAHDGGISLAWPVAISIIPAYLMVSTVRFRSFRDLVSPKTQQAKVITVVSAIAVVLGLAFVPALTGLIVAYFYVLTAPLGVLTRPLRKHLFGPGSIAPPRTRQVSVFLPLVEEQDEEQDEEEADEQEDTDERDASGEPDSQPL